MKVIIITGTPCSGKTTHSKKLCAKNNYEYIDVTRLIKKEKLYEDYDRKNKSFIVDIKKLNKFLIKLILSKNKISKLNGIVIDSHFSHYIPKKYVDKCIVMRCDTKTLRKRLEKRKYSKKKVEGNIEAEIMETCLQEAIKLRHKPIVIRSESYKH